MKLQYEKCEDLKMRVEFDQPWSVVFRLAFIRSTILCLPLTGHNLGSSSLQTQHSKILNVSLHTDTQINSHSTNGIACPAKIS